MSKKKRKLTEVDKMWDLIKHLKVPPVPTDAQREETKNLIEDLFQRKLNEAELKELGYFKIIVTDGTGGSND